MPVPNVGDKAPDFAVVDQDARPVALADLLGSGYLVLVFFRGHWCPFCRRHMTRLQANLERIGESGGRLVGLSIDAPKLSRDLIAELGLGFPMLSDPTSTVVDAYGIRNRLLGTKSGVPHPAVFIIDTQGIVRFREVRHNYKRRMSPSRIIRRLGELRGVSAET
jgi:peroxiredoxin